MSSRNPVHIESLPSGGRVWALDRLDGNFTRVMSAEREFIPQNAEERRLMELGALLRRCEVVNYRLAREILNITSVTIRKLCKEGKLDRVNRAGMRGVTTESVRKWLETGKARNVLRAKI